MKDSEKSILIVLLGIAVLALSIMYVIKPNWEETQSIKAECVQLQDRLTLLQQKEARRDEYLAGIEEYETAFEEQLEHFAPDLNQEVTIMFLEGIKDNNEFEIDSLTLGQPELFYTLGVGSGDTVLPAEGTPADAATTEAPATEEAPAETAEVTDTAATGDLAVDVAESSSYECYRADFPLAYRGSYESLKDVIRYVNEYEDRMTINSIDIAYLADADEYAGAINLKLYSIMSEDRPQTQMEMNEVETGTENIFHGTGSGSSNPTQGMTKYDENDGAAIESSYDFYAMLNPASSDVSAKVVGQNGAGKEASVISNSDNDITTLSFDFYEKDGKNYCKYTLGGSVSYEAEVTSAEDIKLLLQSSARKNDDDKVGIKVTIRNTTKLPVYVKVSGDDSVSPRVNIASKSGSVKVY